MNYQDKTREELIQELQTLQKQNNFLTSTYEKDIVRHKETEERLTVSRDLLFNLAGLVPGVIYQFRLFPDGHSSFPYSSPGMNEIYEVTPEEVKDDTTPIFNRFHPDDFEIVKAAISESARTLDIFYSEYRVILPLQGLRWRWCQAYPERMQDGGTLWHGIVLDITERKQTEDKLLRMVDELKRSQRMAQVGNWKLDLKTGTYSSSDELLRIFGFPIGSYLKIQNVSDCIHPDDLERVTIRRGELLKSKESYSIEFRIIAKDTGLVKSLKSIGEIQCDVDGIPIAIVGTIQDITDNKKSEQILIETNAIIELKQREKETIINSTTDLVWSLDKDLRIITANEAFLNSTKEYSGRVLKQGDYILNPELYSPELNTFWQTLYDEVMNGKTIRKEFHDISISKQGITSLEVNLNPIFHESKVIGIACFCNDITHRIESEKQLKLLSRAIEHTPVSVVITDKNGSIEYVNPKFSALTGYSIDEVKGKNPRVLHSGKHSISFYKELWETILSGKEWKGEFYNKKKNGELYIESAIISPILNKHGEIAYFVAVKEDITEKKMMLEDLIKAKEKAEESDKLKTAFLNNISHEIRTPFNGVLGYLSILQHEELSQKEKDEYIGIINNSAYRLMNTINDIVEISQIQSGQMGLVNQDISIKNVAEEQFIRFKSEAIRKGLTYLLTFNLPDELVLISTDGLKLKTVLYNLIDNALKFTSFGSVELNISKTGDFFKFTITDTGIGIPENKKPTIFDRFMQVDTSKTRLFEGLGLGLSISKAYVEMMNGEIWVDSEVDKGSTFCFTIPHQCTSIGKTVTNNLITHNISNHKLNDLRILIAEDDETSLELIHYVVRSIGKEILIVRNGVDAIKACRNNPDIDLILMDIKMPGMDGHEATRQIRQFNQKVVIIAQTAFAFSGDQEEAIAAGCNDYISKPLNKTTLIGLIKKHF
jgi:PAS domain S-box-containing protein